MGDFIEEGKAVKAFTLEGTDGKTTKKYSAKDLELAVLYFYPKDDTPGCTVEGIEFSANIAKFKKAGCEVFGISADTIDKHEKFIAKHNLKVTLLSDPDFKMMEKYGAFGQKILYGRTFLGIKRSTYIIKAGKVAKVWKSVKAKGHAEKVLESVQKL